MNTTNLSIGGGVQKAVEFIRASLDDDAREFRYALSSVVAENLAGLVDIRSRDPLITRSSPSRSLAGGSAAREVLDLERRFQPDVVYSVFGPPCVRFRSPHLMGFAVGWVTHPNRYAWETLGDPFTKTWYWLLVKRAAYWTRFATRWVLETEVAADGLSRVLGVDRNRCHVIPNACAEQYHGAAELGVEPDPRLNKENASDFHTLVFSAWYPHKNLEIVPLIAAEVRRRDPGRRYRFFLTFDRSSRPWEKIRRQAARLEVEDCVLNLGRALVPEGPGLYRAADAMLLPTVLEVFTATYPEAMCMRCPVVTTDLPFAREICGEAALYFPPNDAAAAADRLVSLARDASLGRDLAGKGRELIARSPSPTGIYRMFIDVLELTARTR